MLSFLGSTKDWAKETKKVVYHVDFESRFMDLSAVETSWKKRKGEGAGDMGMKRFESLRFFRSKCEKDMFFSIKHTFLTISLKKHVAENSQS